MPDYVKVNWRGLDEVKKRLLDANGFLADLDADILGIAETALQLIKNRTPEDEPRPGREEPGTVWTHTRDLWKLEKKGPARYVVDHPYNYVVEFEGRAVNSTTFSLLLALEYGTRAHTIAPKLTNELQGHQLRFYWERKGRWVRAKAVNHPGYGGANAGLGIVRPTAEEVRPVLMEAVDLWFRRRFKR